jgi:phosphoglycolate phosphatase
MNKNFKTGVIFDLDGTLLDTLEDLYESVNYVLNKYHYPKRTKEEVRDFVGNGIKLLMKRALPDNLSEEEFSECFHLFEEYYAENLQKHTQPYPGILSLLDNLKAENVVIGLVSNKFQEGVESLNKMFFSDYIKVAIGNQEGLSPKPAPDSVNLALKHLSLSKERDLIFYIGDSDVDITAKAARLPIISVTWGFRRKEILQELKPDYLVDYPEVILEIVRYEKNKI